MDFKERAAALVRQMTRDEKVSQMLHMTPAIPRLGIPAYSWWNECLHGVTRAGTATMFPQCIGLAATFDDGLVQKVADVISTEARAKHHESLRKEDRGIYKGLTFWSPNINIFRDPRWGRGQETFGEDPYLTSRMGVAFVRGMQGDDPKYLKIAACAKHFVAHSGPEKGRGGFNSEVSERDLRDTYLQAFRACVKEAGVEAIMGAYNRINGEPCVASKTMLGKVLREEWGFQGHVVSDCGAIGGISGGHGVTKSGPESAALAANNGCDLICGRNLGDFLVAAEEGTISEEVLDRIVTRLFTTRMKLGMFDPPEEVPYASIPYEVNDCEEHHAFAREVSRKSMVLLKNEGNLLPLDKNKIKTIAVIGPNADSRPGMTGNYCPTPSKSVTVLEGVAKAVNPDTRVYYAQGCHLYKEKTEGTCVADNRETEAVSAAERADVVIMAMGLDFSIEGEEGDTFNEYSSGDKMHLNLPGRQQHLLEAVCATGKPVVLVLIAGSVLSVNWADEHVPAILQAWYPGAEGGDTIASLLFGEESPSGRTPVTFYRGVEELPAFEDYSMENRTYRYMKNEALYPFGFGLSYTDFEYGEISLSAGSIAVGESLACSVSVKNTGAFDSDEVAQVYIKSLDAPFQKPVWSLCGTKRIHLRKGAMEEVRFTLTDRILSMIDDDGKRVLQPGRYCIYMGGSQPDAREKLTGHWVRSAEFILTGNRTEIEY